MGRRLLNDSSCAPARKPPASFKCMSGACSVHFHAHYRRSDGAHDGVRSRPRAVLHRVRAGWEDEEKNSVLNRQ